MWLCRLSMTGSTRVIVQCLVRVGKRPRGFHVTAVSSTEAEVIENRLSPARCHVLVGTPCHSGQKMTNAVRSVGDMTTPHSTPPVPTAASSGPAAQERADLIDALRKHRGLFRLTVAGLTDEQARLSPTVSSLSLGGLVKHVAAVEQQWASFVVDGPAPSPGIDWASIDWRTHYPRCSSTPMASGCWMAKASP